MCRVPLLTADEAPLLAAPVYAGGDPGPIARALANVPELLQPALAMFGAVLGPSAIAPRPKEIVVLRTSAMLDCRYCVQAHTVVALDAGLSADEVRSLRGHDPLHRAFTAPEDLALIEWVDALACGTGPVADVVAERLALHWRDFEVVELTLLVGTTMLLNRFCTGLDLPSGPETLTRLAAEGLL